MNWSVTEAGISKISNSSAITFSEPNGTYVFTFGGNHSYRPQPTNFTVRVNGHNISLVVVWFPVLYPVTFVETGLPGGAFWNVTLGNKSNYSSNSTIVFKVMNGTYDYSIPIVNGIASSTSNGTIKVSGAPTRVFVLFTLPVNFTFYERGLPTGSHWSVLINGHYYNSTSSIISVTLPNNTYSFVVVLPPGYYSTPTEGKVNYANNLVLVNVNSFLIYEIIISVLVLLIAVFLAIYIRRIRRRGRTGGTKGEPPETK